MIAICSHFCSSEGVKDSREVDNEKKKCSVYDVSFVLNCRRGQIANFAKKTPQVHLILIRE